MIGNIYHQTIIYIYILNDIVVYNQKKRRTRRDIGEVAQKIDEQKAEMKRLTDKDGLGRSYSTDNDLSIIDNTSYISRTHMNRPSDWYDNVFKVPSLWNAVPLVSQYKAFMFGMKALPYIADLAR